MESGPHNLFSDMSFGGPNIHLVRIQLSLDSKISELRPLWVSAVHAWVGVAGHLAESLSRISLSRFSLLSFHSSFDRARTGRSYFRIWKHWSKHTTLVNIELYEVTNWPGLCIYGLVAQWHLPPTDCWHGADSSRHVSGGLQHTDQA